MKTAFYDTGIGDSYDSLMSLKASPFFGMENDKEFYAHIYANSWQARKMCEYYPQLMSNTWGKVELAEANQPLLDKLQPYLNRLKQLFREGQILANIYGGATIVKYIDDGNDFDQPINYNKIKSIDYSRVFDRWDVFPLTLQLSENIYEPDYYQYFTGYQDSKLTTGYVHKDRIIRFRGKYLPPELMKNNDYWELSVLHDFLEPYLRYYTATSRTLEAVRSAELFIVGIENLAERDEIAKTEQKEVQTQMAQNKGIVKDKDTIDIEIISRKFQGIKDLLELAKNEMVASSGLTFPQMYQEFPSGLNATGKSELMAEALSLNNKQETQWGGLIRNELELLMAFFKSDNQYEWTWNNAYFNTPLEEAELKLKIAQSDKIYSEIQAISAEEIRESHFGGNTYESDISLNESIEVDESENHNEKE